MSEPTRVAIHYRRPPDDVRIYDQRIVLSRSDVIITLSDPLELSRPVTVEGEAVLETGSLALWFTFPGVWHDIGRFHRADGHYTGAYANVLTPPELGATVWKTTDLFLDVWLAPGGDPVLLDEDEFEDARGRGLVEEATAVRALREAHDILARARRGAWPPAIVREWTLERALEALAATPR